MINCGNFYWSKMRGTVNIFKTKQLEVILQYATLSFNKCFLCELTPKREQICYPFSLERQLGSSVIVKFLWKLDSKIKLERIWFSVSVRLTLYMMPIYIVSVYNVNLTGASDCLFGCGSWFWRQTDGCMNQREKDFLFFLSIETMSIEYRIPS